MKGEKTSYETIKINYSTFFIHSTDKLKHVLLLLNTFKCVIRGIKDILFSGIDDIS